MNILSRDAMRFFLLLFVLTSAVFACGRGLIIPMSPVDIQLTQQAAPSGSPHDLLVPGIPEVRMLTLDFPSKMRAGDFDLVRLTLEVDVNGNLTPIVVVDEEIIGAAPLSLPDIFDTHNVVAEARLELPGVDVRPGETVSATLMPGDKLTFYWNVLPSAEGRYSGTVWFFLRYVPREGGVETRQAITAQQIEIEAITLFGLKTNAARWLGFIGVLVGLILLQPFLLAFAKSILTRGRRE